MAGGFRPSAALSLPYATGITITAAGAALLYLLATTSDNAAASGRKKRNNVIPSPRTTLLPQLSAVEQDDLPYPPDGLLPGARDVDSPYGSVRVYEWGPEDGPKVLLVHGISTPCIALAAVAEELVRSGRRVMLFDLFGRGFSDSPADLPYDSRLYTTQILLALASSPLSWTGSSSSSSSFSIVGYSLGGGIAADFASYFYPTLISSLVLIAPGGVMRRERVSWKSWWLYDVCGAPALSAVMPGRLLRWMVGRRLYTPVDDDDDAAASSSTTTTPGDVGNPAQAEAGQVVTVQRGRRDSMLSHPAPLLGPDRPHVTAAGAVNWQLAHHRGFVVPAFVSSMRCAPIYGQQERWRVVGEKVEAERVAAAAAVEQGGRESGRKKGVLLLLGRDDPIVLVDEVGKDAVDALDGEDNVRTVVLEAGHEVPMSKPKEVVRAMVEFWEGGVQGAF